MVYPSEKRRVYPEVSIFRPVRRGIVVHSGVVRSGGGEEMGMGSGTWYALIASSRKTKRAKHPFRESLVARFQEPGITSSSICPNGSSKALIAYSRQLTRYTPISTNIANPDTIAMHERGIGMGSSEGGMVPPDQFSPCLWKRIKCD
jgi:hypothetical protein